MGVVAVSGAFAANGSLDAAFTTQIRIAPLSIPVGSSGTTDIGMVRLGVRSGANLDTTSISSITVQALSDGTFNDSWVTGIRVYYEAQGGDGEYFHGGTPADTRADSGVHTFSSGTATIALNPTIAKFTRPGGGANYLYVVFDLAATPTIDAGTTLLCNITSFRYGLPDVGDTANSTPPALTLLTSARNLDNYTTTLDAAYEGPLTAAANATKVPVLQLDFDVADATTTANVDSIKVHRIYGQDNYVSTVFLYSDVNVNGSFEPSPGADGAPIASASLSSGYATLNPTAVLPVTSAGKSFFVAVDMDGVNAQVGQYFGLNVDNPSTDIVFVDEIEDDNDLVPTEYAYVPGNGSGAYEYTQLGYITSATADPTVDPANSFLINPPEDGQPPSVVTTVPTPPASGVSRTANLSVVFSEWMTKSIVEDLANFILTDGVTPSIAVNLSFDELTQTLTVDPSVTLYWGRTCTATVKGAVQDYYGNAMGSDYSWNFTIESASAPTVVSTTPTTGALSVDRDSIIYAVFSEPMEPTTIVDANFSLIKRGDVIEVPGVVSYEAGFNRLKFVPGAPLDWSAVYDATITTDVTDVDALGQPVNMAAPYIWDFTVEPAVYPVVLNTEPDDDAVNVVRAIEVKATFSEAVTGVDATSFTLWNGGSKIVGTTVSYDPGTLTATLTPPAILDFSTEYTAKLEYTKIKDSDNLTLRFGGLDMDTVWSFWTVSAVPPAILSVTPSENAIGVPIASTVQVVFSKPINASTLTTTPLTGSFRVTDAQNNPVTGSIAYDNGTFTVTFTPSAPLAYLQTYKVTVTRDVRDTDNQQLNQAKSWSFTTFGFTRATIVNNRLGAGGGSSETLIFVPQVNATDKVSVQVFTTTGKLVRTFYKNVNFSTVPVPIRWDGTNDKGQALGPGLYFVQIVAAGVKQTLKVLIVR
jgi:hypothetical protein